MENYLKKIKIFSKTIKKRWSKLTKKQKNIVFVLAFMVVGFFFMRTRNSNTGDIQYQFTTVEKRSVKSVVSESGEIVSTGLTDVSSTITGIVSGVFVENGQAVKRGEKLFSVVSTATEEERATAYSAYQSAKAGLNSANSTFRSKQATVDRIYDEISGHDDDESLETRETRTVAEVARDNSYYSITSAEAAVAKTWLAYQATADGTVKNTANGVVANLSVAEGQHVNSQYSALLIVSDGGIWITISVTENDVVELEPGQKADISVDALPDEKLTGIVMRFDSVGTVESGVVTYNIHIQVDQNDTNVLPSMTVSVDIVTNQKDAVLTIPNSAIKPYQGSKAVQILDEGTGQTIYIPIKVGIVGTTRSEVLSGLVEGQQIISSVNGGEEQSQGGGVMPFGGGR